MKVKNIQGSEKYIKGIRYRVENPRTTHNGQEGRVSVIVKNDCDWFPEPGARPRRFPHLFCLLSAEPLYYAAVFIEGGGMDTTHRPICPTQWCIS